MDFVFDLDFLDLYTLEYNKTMSHHQVIERLLTEYTQYKLVIITEKKRGKLETYLFDNIPSVFQAISNVAGFELYKTLGDYLSNNNSERGLVFSDKVKDHIEEIKLSSKVGFSWYNLFDDIINFEQSFKINKNMNSEEEFWNEFNKIGLCLNDITIVDKYILREDGKQLAELCKKVCSYSDSININVFYQKVPIISKIHETEYDNMKSFLEKSKLRLHSVLTRKKIKPNFIYLYYEKLKGKFDFHDRYLYHPYGLIKAGGGFDEKGKVDKTNSDILSSSLFDKYSFRKMREHKEMQNKYIDSVSPKTYSTNKVLIFFPEPINNIN